MAINPNLFKTQVAQDSILDINGRQTYLGNVFVASNPGISVGTTETPIYILTNPSTNTKSLFVFTKKLTCVTVGNSCLFKTYYNPTITAAGTAITPVNMRTGSTFTSTATVQTSPTASSNGTFLGTLSSLAFSPNVSTVMHVIDPGGTLLITATASALATSVATEVLWYEL